MTKTATKKITENIIEIIERDFYMQKDDDGVYDYKIYAENGDELGDHSLKKIFNHDNPEDAFYDELSEFAFSCECDYKTELIRTLTNTYIKEYVDLDDDDDDYEDVISSWVDEYVCFSFPYDHYLEQDVNVDILIDTGDLNYDYVLNAIYPHYIKSDDEPIPEEAGVVWLAKSQGYTIDDVTSALREQNFKGSKFLESLYTEISNCTSVSNALTFCVRMTLKECFDLQSKIERTNDKPYLPPESLEESCFIGVGTGCGLFDKWDGAGSVLEIELEKDVELPYKYIWQALPDCCINYSIEEVYGMMRSFWEKGIIYEREEN